MNFKCKELSISNEDLGCTITFSDTIEKEFYKTHRYDEINEDEIYLMLQRTYPKDDYEKDYYYIELSDFDRSGELNDFTIELNENSFKIEWDTNKSGIKIDINQEEFEKLKEALKIITHDRGQIIVNE